MADVYWYISADKVRMLNGAKARSTWKQLSLKLKLNLLEVETGVAFNESLVRDLNRLKKELAQDHSIIPFQDLKAGAEGGVFSFTGEATRLLTNDALWIGAENQDSALLLVGAPRNAAGESRLKEGFLSPSLDPVGAVKALGRGEQRTTLVAALTFVWQEVMRDAFVAGSHFPGVEGLAIFAGGFALERPFENRPTIERIVVGSPIYVRQASAETPTA
jgi:hypothetical protein